MSRVQRKFFTFVRNFLKEVFDTFKNLYSKNDATKEECLCLVSL